MNSHRKRGRSIKASPSIEVHIHLRLRVGEDDDLISFFSEQRERNKAQAIRCALRQGGVKALSTLDTAEDIIFSDALEGLLL
ncbi:MAG TPA: hypothetical protein PKW33_14830 [Anaerolineaceae bacterium]|nr:hypothetical protein [Anaerolineaceae bacterium]HPN52866.1 hypothetical protein [Anaerolineaceae bacterium]